MPRRCNDEAAASFLCGDPAIVGEIRAIVERVISGFDFHDLDLRRDLVQEALGRMVVSLRAGRFRGDALLTTYAHSVARYTCIEHLRRRRREAHLAKQTATAAQARQPEESLLRLEAHRRNLIAFAALPEETRTLLSLVFNDGLSYEQVGRRLGISVAAVKSRIHRCRMLLRGGA